MRGRNLTKGLLLVLVSSVGIASCSDDGGYGPGYYYAACRADYDCVPGLACIKDAGGVCAAVCEHDYDCGPAPYRCRKRDREGASGKISVCMSR
jgi:hypothetical protein